MIAALLVLVDVKFWCIFVSARLYRKAVSFCGGGLYCIISAAQGLRQVIQAAITTSSSDSSPVEDVGMVELAGAVTQRAQFLLRLAAPSPATGEVLHIVLCLFFRSFASQFMGSFLFTSQVFNIIMIASETSLQ